MERKQFWALLFVFGSLALASRLPLSPGQLFSFDDVNFAYAIGHFDPRISQPQPPGYPLFVMETRVLRRLRFKRAESNLFALSLAGSIAALLALAWLGGEMAGVSAGWCAAWLLLFHHSFWYGALTSAIRVQLALISAAVAAACYRAWKGERRWIYGSAMALGLGAGIRPEMGALLFPLWVVSAARAAGRLREFLRGLALLGAVVLAWLVPTMLASGGPLSYVRLCWNYLADQSTLTSGLFGAPEAKWSASVVWLCVWALSGVLTWPLAAALAWRRGEGFGFTWSQTAFLALWFIPSFAFAILVHIADAGQALAMVPVVCLVGGCLISRAGSRPVEPRISHEHVLLFLISASLLIDALAFFRPGWYHQVQPATGWRAVVEQAWADIDSGLDQTSLGQIHRTVAADDHALRALRELAAERPGPTVVVWEQGITTWRKAAYYFPRLEVIVLSHKRLSGPSSPVAQIFQGPHLKNGYAGPAPLRVALPAGARVVWFLNPDTSFFRELARSLPLQPAGPLYYCDLPPPGGQARVGDYLLVW